MHTYAKLKDGRIGIIWSSCSAERTYTLYLADEKNFNPAQENTLFTVSEDEILVIDSNYESLTLYK